MKDEAAPEAAVGGLDAAPGLLAQAEDERVDEAHQADAEVCADAEAFDGVVGELVPVVHAVQGEGDEPHERVDERVDEDEAELAVDALAAFGLAELAAALDWWGGDVCGWRRKGCGFVVVAVFCVEEWAAEGRDGVGEALTGGDGVESGSSDI